MSRERRIDVSIGSAVRERRLLRGWSIRFAASRAGISHATWSRIERGLQAADSRFMLAEIAAALECSPSDLSGMATAAADRKVAAAYLAVPSIRRAIVDVDLDDAAWSPARMNDRWTHDLALVSELYNRCDYCGAATMLPNVVDGLAASAAGADRKLSLPLLLEAISIASRLVWKLGFSGDAWLAAERCREIAALIGQPVSTARTALVRSLAAIDCGSFDRALALAERAARDLDVHLAKPSALEVFGTLYLVCAAANYGLHRVDERDAYLRDAVELARRTGDASARDFFFGPTNVELWRLALEADDGEPHRALEIAHTVRVAAISAPSRQVFYYADVARAYSQIDGREQDAIRYLLIAERVAPQHLHSSAFIRETGRGLLERTQQQAGSSALRGICERMGIGG